MPDETAQQRMTVLVTGASGFIGQCVSQKLVEMGHEVTQVVRRPGLVAECGPQKGIQVDLSEPIALEHIRGLCQDDKPDVLIHLAAMIPTAFAGAEAERIAEFNRRIDENVFWACEGLGIRVVYASSTSVYGLGDGELKRESSPISPLGPYADAKLIGEKLGKELCSRAGVSFTALRIAAPYGPGSRLRTVLNIFIERAIEGQPLMYHGSGSRLQDFTYVGDVAEAAIKAAIRGLNGIYNISGGRPITMRELANLVVRCVPQSASFVSPSGEIDPQEGATAMYSITKAISDLGWRPQVSLEAGIRACVRYRLKERNESWTSV